MHNNNIVGLNSIICQPCFEILLHLYVSTFSGQIEQMRTDFYYLFAAMEL